MNILITGTPGTGKSSVSKIVAKHFKLKVINEKEFAKKKGIGKFDKKEKELQIPLKSLQKELNSTLAKGNVLVEGHLLCEIKLKVDFAVLLWANPDTLLSRLLKRKYSAVKVFDNVFAEMNGYCKKQLHKNYPKSKIIEAESANNIKQTAQIIIREINKRLAPFARQT